MDAVIKPAVVSSRRAIEPLLLGLDWSYAYLGLALFLECLKKCDE